MGGTKSIHDNIPVILVQPASNIHDGIQSFICKNMKCVLYSQYYKGLISHYTTHRINVIGLCRWRRHVPGYFIRTISYAKWHFDWISMTNIQWKIWNFLDFISLVLGSVVILVYAFSFRNSIDQLLKRLPGLGKTDWCIRRQVQLKANILLNIPFCCIESNFAVHAKDAFLHFSQNIGQIKSNTVITNKCQFDYKDCIGSMLDIENWPEST